MKKNTQVTGVFLIAASTHQVMRNRVDKIEAETRFSTCGQSSWEKGEGGGYYRVVMQWTGKTKYKKIERAIQKMQAWPWFWDRDSSVECGDGTYIFCEGEFV